KLFPVGVEHFLAEEAFLDHERLWRTHRHAKRDRGAPVIADDRSRHADLPFVRVCVDRAVERSICHPAARCFAASVNPVGEPKAPSLPPTLSINAWNSSTPFTPTGRA